MRRHRAAGISLMVSGAQHEKMLGEAMHESHTITMHDVFFRYVEEEAQRTGVSQDELIEFAIGALAYLRRESSGAALTLWRQPGRESDASLSFCARQLPLTDPLFARIAELPAGEILRPSNERGNRPSGRPSLRLIVSEEGAD